MFSFSSCYRSLPVAAGGHGHKLTVFSFGCCHRSLPVTTGGHKLTVFSFSSSYRSLPVTTGGTQVDDVCFDSCYKSLPVAVVAFVFLSAIGRYRWIQAVVSAFPLLLAGCNYMRITVCFYQFIVIPRGFHPLEPPLFTNNC